MSALTKMIGRSIHEAHDILKRVGETTTNVDYSDKFQIVEINGESVEHISTGEKLVRLRIQDNRVIGYAIR